MVYDDVRKTVWEVLNAKKSKRVNIGEKNKRYRNRLINDLAGIKANHTYEPRYLRRAELKEVISESIAEGRKVNVKDIVAKMKRRNERA